MLMRLTFIGADHEVTGSCHFLEVGDTKAVSYTHLTGTNMTWTEDGEPEKDPKAVQVVDGAYKAME